MVSVLALSSAVEANLVAFALVSSAGIALILCVVAALTFQRLQSRRSLLIGLAFLLFSARSAWLLSAYMQDAGLGPALIVGSFLDVAAFVLLVLSMRMRA